MMSCIISSITYWSVGVFLREQRINVFYLESIMEALTAKNVSLFFFYYYLFSQ